MDILDDIELIDEHELFRSIWTKPRLTLDFILRNCPKRYLTTLFVLGGITNALGNRSTDLNSSAFSPMVMIPMAIVVGGLLGWVFYYIYASLLGWTGKWIKGIAGMDQFLTVLAWASIPTIFSLLLVIPELFITDGNPGSVDISSMNISTVIPYWLIKIGEAVLAVWSLAIMMKGIALIQNFSIGKAILNAILPLFVIIIPICIIFGLIYMMK